VSLLKPPTNHSKSGSYKGKEPPVTVVALSTNFLAELPSAKENVLKPQAHLFSASMLNSENPHL